MEAINKFRLGVALTIIIAVIFDAIGLPKGFTDFVITKIVLGLIVGIATGRIAGALTKSLDDLGDGWLKRWVLINYEILDYNFSFTAFGLTTILIEWIIFH